MQKMYALNLCNTETNLLFYFTEILYFIIITFGFFLLGFYKYFLHDTLVDKIFLGVCVLFTEVLRL